MLEVNNEMSVFLFSGPSPGYICYGPQQTHQIKLKGGRSTAHVHRQRFQANLLRARVTGIYPGEGPLSSVVIFVLKSLIVLESLSETSQDRNGIFPIWGITLKSKVQIMWHVHQEWYISFFRYFSTKFDTSAVDGHETIAITSTFHWNHPRNKWWANIVQNSYYGKCTGKRDFTLNPYFWKTCGEN
jgi:hypothetical protein